MIILLLKVSPHKPVSNSLIREVLYTSYFIIPGLDGILHRSKTYAVYKQKAKTIFWGEGYSSRLFRTKWHDKQCF